MCRWVTKGVRGLEHLTYEHRLSDLGLYIVEKRRVWEDLTASFQYLNRAPNGAGEGHSTRSCSDRASENVFKLKEIRFKLNFQKKILYCEAGDTHTQCPETL